MFKKIIRQQNLRGVGDGSRATAEMGSLGSTIHNMYLSFYKSGGVEMTRTEIEADVDTVYVRVGGDLKIEAPIKFLFDMFDYYNDANDVGNPDAQVLLPLACQDLLTELERTVFAYGTNNVDSFIIEVQFKQIGAGFLTEYVELRTQQTDVLAVLGQHRKIRRYAQNYNSAGGQQDITTLPNRIPNMAYKALHIHEGDSSLDKVTVKIATSEIFKDVTPNLNKMINGMRARTNQAGIFTVDFFLDGNLTGGLPMINIADFRQELTWSGQANGYDIMTEELWGLNLQVK